MLEFNDRKIKRLSKKFEKIAFRVYRNGQEPCDSKLVRDRRMRAWFGASSKTIAKAWTILARSFDNELIEGATKERFLWAFILLKSYATEENNASRVGGVDEGTFRKWSWYFIEEFSYCEDDVVSLCCVCWINYVF